MSNPSVTEFIATRTKRAHAQPGPVGIAGVEPSHDGYMVHGEGAQFSQWVGKAAFEAVYQPVSAMGFGHALILLQAGRRVARALWREGVIEARGTSLFVVPANGEALRWRPDQADLFATDWRVVE